MDEDVIKRLVSAIKCGVCGGQFELTNVNILGQQDDTWFLQVICPACFTQCLVAVVLGTSELPTPPSELSEGEAARFNRMGKLSSAEQQNMRNFLNTFNGDFKQLFRR